MYVNQMFNSFSGGYSIFSCLKLSLLFSLICERYSYLKKDMFIRTKRDSLYAVKAQISYLDQNL
jgi:hypothetical protein